MPRDYRFRHALTGTYLPHERFNDSWDVYATPCGKKVSKSQEPERWTAIPREVTCIACKNMSKGVYSFQKRTRPSTVLPRSAKR